MNCSLVKQNVNCLRSYFEYCSLKKYIRESLDLDYQVVKRQFALTYDNTSAIDQISVDSFKKYFLLRVKIENYNIEIDGINFYEQGTNDSIKQNDEVRKVSTRQGDDYTTGCLFDVSYFERKYRVIAADLSNLKKALDADSRAILRIIFSGKIKATVANSIIIIYYILKQSKETNSTVP